MIDLSNIALFIADTRDHQLAINIIAHCCKKIKFGQIIFLTDKKKEELDFSRVDESILNIHHIRPIKSKDEYSNLILYDLYGKADVFFKNIRYVLVIQTDGFIVNPDAWEAKYLEYDYIGAPWGYYPNNQEPGHPVSTASNCVGNGGFSLRSVKLIENIHNLLSSNVYPQLTPEDVFICRTLRPELEKLGIKFAPEAIAERFSCENKPYKGQFGYHGDFTFKLNKATLTELMNK